MDLTAEQRVAFEHGLNNAKTVLDALFYGWLLHLPGSARLFWEEIQIVELGGPGNEVDDFIGDHPSPDW